MGHFSATPLRVIPFIQASPDAVTVNPLQVGNSPVMRVKLFALWENWAASVHLRYYKRCEIITPFYCHLGVYPSVALLRCVGLPTSHQAYVHKHVDTFAKAQLQSYIEWTGEALRVLRGALKKRRNAAQETCPPKIFIKINGAKWRSGGQKCDPPTSACICTG